MQEVLDLLDTGSARLTELDGDSERVDELRLSVETDSGLVEILATGVTGFGAKPRNVWDQPSRQNSPPWRWPMPA